MASNGNIVSGEWIVSLRAYATDAMDESHLTEIRTKTEDSSTHFNCDVRCHFKLPELHGYVAKFDDETRAELEGLSEVAAIEPVQIYRHCTTSATSTVQTDAPWGLARISRREKVAPTGPFQYRYKATGEDTIAYVLDTGINDAHVEFEGRASRGPVFSSSSNANDNDGHGTHVAGTIAGKTYGVAKKARVVGVKVFDDKPNPGATNADIIKAIEWVVDEAKSHGKPSVINLSLGGGRSDILDQAVASAVRAGVTCVVAAGNSSRPADIGSPSREPLAITVGATSIQDAHPQFGDYGKTIDILAPGVDIMSAWIGKSNKETSSISGTSMACPHVAGAICCLLEKERLEPLLVMPQLLTWADKNKVSGLKPRTINALLQVSDE